MRWRHPNVGHHQLRGALANQREELATVTRLPNHIEPRPVQQTGQTLSEQQIVIGYHYLHRDHHLPGRLELILHRSDTDAPED
jgi:hypothetical protein